MKDERKDGFEDGNWVEKSKTQKSLGVKNIEDFNHNSAENADFDDGTNLKIQNAAPESIR